MCHCSDHPAYRGDVHIIIIVSAQPFHAAHVYVAVAVEQMPHTKTTRWWFSMTLSG